MSSNEKLSTTVTCSRTCSTTNKGRLLHCWSGSDLLPPPFLLCLAALYFYIYIYVHVNLSFGCRESLLSAHLLPLNITSIVSAPSLFSSNLLGSVSKPLQGSWKDFRNLRRDAGHTAATWLPSFNLSVCVNAACVCFISLV